MLRGQSVGAGPRRRTHGRGAGEAIMGQTIKRDTDGGRGARSRAAAAGPNRETATGRGQRSATELGRELLQLMLTTVEHFAVFTIDPEGRHVSWNPGVRRLFGYGEEEFLGADASLIFTPEDRERGASRLEMETAAREGRAEDERWHIRRDGSSFWASGQLVALRDGDGALRGYAKVVRDATERKRAEEYLLLGKHFSDATIDSLPGIFYVFDAAGRFIRWNRNFERVTGYGFEEVAHLSPLELFEGGDRRLVRERTAEVFAAGRSTVEAAILTKGGERIPHFLTGSRLTFDGRECAIGMGIDLTELKRAEAERERLLDALEQERLRLAQVLRQMPSGVAIAEAPSGKLLYHNEEAVRLLRHPLPDSDTVAGYGQYGALRPDGTRLPPGEYPLARAVAGEVVRNEQMAYRRADGTLTDFVVNAAPIRDAAGRVVAAVSVFDDTSEMRRVERELARLLESEQEARRQAEEATRLKDEFLATLSHELRNPLTAVLGWSRLLRSGSLDAESAARAVEAIERNAAAQKQLIEDVLDVSRIITGRMRLDAQHVRIVSVVEAAVDTIRPAADARGVRILVHLPPDAGAVSGDPDRLQQVVWNLLTNAVKFTPEGGTVEVWVEREPAGGLSLIVRDSGQGIAPDFLPYVFDRFRQADQQITRRHGGLGLGLSIVKHIVELHGGTIRAESEGEGRGATFTVTFPATGPAPVAVPPVARAAPDVGAEKYCPPALDGLSVLAVDDEPDALEFIKTVLENCGAKVLTAGSAAAALGALKEGWPDVLVSDIGMPEMSGFELIRQVRMRGRERGKQVPAVALTAYAREEDRRQVIRAGYQTHLPKPVEPEDLIAAVASLAGKFY
jgi:PAS domain S-box-containing protein